jgi:glycerol-3-phosphate dehydrogenase (NAD(P)+)
MKKKMNVLILGAGAWGGTLGNLLAGKDFRVALWEPSRDGFERIKRNGYIACRGPVEFRVPVKGVMDVYGNAGEAFAAAAGGGKECLVVFAVPSHAVKDVSATAAEFIPRGSGCVFVSVVKGIDTGTMETMSGVICGEIPQARGRIAVLSGPSFAVEVLNGKPAAVVAASRNDKVARLVQSAFMTEYFRVYTSGDVRGVEIGGSLKNVFAVACGVSDGLDMGDNAKSALITRGMRELVKLGIKLGGKAETFYGLSGLGDLITTCFSKNSRNRMFGELIAKGKKPALALSAVGSAVEGYRTAFSAYRIGRETRMELPVINETYRILYKGKDPRVTVRDLMTRASKEETK